MDRIKGQKLQSGFKFEKTQLLEKALQFLISLCVLQSGIKFEKTQLLKKALQFLISVCVFFVLLSNPSKFSILDLLFNLHFSLFSFQLFDHPVDRKYMFLLCNGILVILAMNSGLISSSPEKTADLYDEFHGKKREYLQRLCESSEKKASASEEEVVLGSIENSENASVVEGREVVLENIENSEKALVVGGKGGNGCLNTVKEENGYLIAVGPLGQLGFLTATAVAEEEEEEEEEEGNGCPSTDEFNKKCEDFIRRFKAGIRTESQRRIVVV